MSMPAVEVDLPQTENNLYISPKPQKLLDRRRSFRDIQSGISKINPQLLKSLIASGSSPNPSESPSEKSYSVPSTPKEHPNSYPAFPIYIPTFRPSSTSETGGPETAAAAALTIFYNGTVSVFQVPPHQAENILKLAQEAGGGSQAHDESTTDSKLAVSSAIKQQLLETLNRDLPIARRKSLRRFFEKRKERLTMVSPYECTTKQASSGQNSPAVVPKD